jgi:hypothetical protein
MAHQFETDEMPPAKKVMWEDDVDSSDDESDHSIYFENNLSYWYCTECKTCITRKCVVGPDNQHFQFNKEIGKHFPTVVTNNGITYNLVIHRTKDTEIFGYFVNRL